MNIRASPVVVRCLRCAAAVDRSSAGTCPFCGTDVASMPVIEPEPEGLDEVEPIAAAPAVTALAVVARPAQRRRRRWPLLLVLALAVGAVFAGKDFRLLAGRRPPASMPSIAIPFESTQPTTSPAPPTPAPPTQSPAASEQGVAAPVPTGCGFFTTQAIDRQYDFARGRADLAFQRANEINDHYYALDHDKKGHDARAKAAADAHNAAIATLSRELSRARDTCDPDVLF